MSDNSDTKLTLSAIGLTGRMEETVPLSLLKP